MGTCSVLDTAGLLQCPVLLVSTEEIRQYAVPVFVIYLQKSGSFVASVCFYAVFVDDVGVPNPPTTI